MGMVKSSVGHLCVDLSHIEMTGNEQQALLETVQEAVIQYLAKLASNYKVVTISLSPNNGTKEKEEEDEPAPHDAPERHPVPDRPSRDVPMPEPAESAWR